MLELGQLLFFDPILSGNKDASCSNCHRPERGMTDGLSLSVEVPDEPVTILGNTEDLRQILDNLLGNATKYTPGGGSIRVTLTAEGDFGEGLTAFRRVLLWNTIYDPQSGRVCTPVTRSWT